MKTVDIHIKTDNQNITLKVSKIVKIKKEESSKNFIYFDELCDGSFRLVFTNDILKEIK